jgi:hypothetical protein
VGQCRDTRCAATSSRRPPGHRHQAASERALQSSHNTARNGSSTPFVDRRGCIATSRHPVGAGSRGLSKAQAAILNGNDRVGMHRRSQMVSEPPQGRWPAFESGWGSVTNSDILTPNILNAALSVPSSSRPLLLGWPHKGGPAIFYRLRQVVSIGDIASRQFDLFDACHVEDVVERILAAVTARGRPRFYRNWRWRQSVATGSSRVGASLGSVGLWPSRANYESA